MIRWNGFWVISFCMFVISAGSISAFAQVSAVFNDHIRIGPSSAPCGPDIEGAVRYSSVGQHHELCVGGDWRQFVTADIVEGAAVSEPLQQGGYFVLSSGTWHGNIGDWHGGNDKCLADLTANDWMGKADALARDMLHPSRVKAFLCSANFCQGLLPEVSYAFASSGNPAVGGATIVADSSGIGPGDNANWSGASYFGSAVQYWTGRTSGTDSTKWVETATLRCSSGNSWYLGTNSNSGQRGSSNSTTQGRWNSGSSLCDVVLHLVCIVHPDH